MIFGTSQAAWFLVEGTAQVEVDGEVVSSYGKGSYFGELALLNNEPRAASVRCTSACKCLALNREDFYGKTIHKASAAAFLQSVACLSRMERAERDEMVGLLRVRYYRPGEKIIYQGEAGKELYLLQEGSCSVEVDGVARPAATSAPRPALAPALNATGSSPVTLSLQ